MTTGIGAATVKRVAAMRSIGIAHSYHMRNIEFGTSTQTVIGRITMRVLDPVDLSERLKGRAWERHLKNVAQGISAGFTLDTRPAPLHAKMVNWQVALLATERARVFHVHFEQKPPFSTVRMEAAANSLPFLRQHCA